MICNCVVLHDIKSKSEVLLSEFFVYFHHAFRGKNTRFPLCIVSYTEILA